MLDRKAPVSLDGAAQDDFKQPDEGLPDEEDFSDVDGLVDPLGDAREVGAAELDEDVVEEVSRAMEAAPPAPPARPSQPAPPQSADDADAIVRAAKAMRGGEEAAQARAKRCLVVDDSRVIRKITGSVAKNMGFAVAEAENGEEALAICKKTMPDLVITDWDMPEMDGLSFVTALRAIPTSHAPKVVFCTSKGSNSNIHAGIAAGADDYIVKPFKEEGLRAKLEQLGLV